jgi:hypothetical protein
MSTENRSKWNKNNSAFKPVTHQTKKTDESKVIGKIDGKANKESKKRKFKDMATLHQDKQLE